MKYHKDNDPAVSDVNGNEKGKHLKFYLNLSYFR